MADQNPNARAGGQSTVRQSDIEPYTALKWVGTLFKAASIFLAIAIAGEFVAGIRMQGSVAVPTLLGELAKTVVFAVVLWGGGDLVRLLVQLGNDIRAQRILLSRLVYRAPQRTESAADGRTHASALDSAGLLESGDKQEDEAARRSLGES